MSSATLAALDPVTAGTGEYRVSLKPGVNAGSYTTALTAALGDGYLVGDRGGDRALVAITTLVGLLTLLIIGVAGLGVLNTVALQVRERAHDIGIFKALGMTPRQTLTMVVCSVAVTGLVAGIIAVPAGIALHHNVLPSMAHAASSNVPGSVMSVFSLPEMIGLALAGLLIAVIGALAPPPGRPLAHRRRAPHRVTHFRAGPALSRLRRDGGGRMDSFAGKLAVVTGGGSGMGRELVVKLAAAGCAVAACDVRQAAAEETAALARAGAPDGTMVTAHACDVADEAQVARFRDEALAAHGAGNHGPATWTWCSATRGPAGPAASSTTRGRCGSGCSRSTSGACTTAPGSSCRC